jgi:hypothetical protein
MDKGKLRRGAGYVAGAAIGAGTAYLAAKGMGLHENADLWQKAPQDFLVPGAALGSGVVHAGYQALKNHAENTRLGRQFKK